MMMKKMIVQNKRVMMLMRRRREEGGHHMRWGLRGLHSSAYVRGRDLRGQNLITIIGFFVL